MRAARRHCATLRDARRLVHSCLLLKRFHLRGFQPPESRHVCCIPHRLLARHYSRRRCLRVLRCRLLRCRYLRLLRCRLLRCRLVLRGCICNCLLLGCSSSVRLLLLHCCGCCCGIRLVLLRGCSGCRFMLLLLGCCCLLRVAAIGRAAALLLQSLHSVFRLLCHALHHALPPHRRALLLCFGQGIQGARVVPSGQTEHRVGAHKPGERVGQGGGGVSDRGRDGARDQGREGGIEGSRDRVHRSRNNAGCCCAGGGGAHLAARFSNCPNSA